MTLATSVHAWPDGERAALGADAALAAGLAAAASAPAGALTIVATRAPVAPAHVLVGAAHDEAIFAWTAADSRAVIEPGPQVLVGIGVAREVRGDGDARWQAVVDGASSVRVHAATVDGVTTDPGLLGLARPRFVGGAAFAPGAAAKVPWVGFGDAWFALPRWTYVHDGREAWLVLVIEARDAVDAARWQRELAAHRTALTAAAAPPAQPAITEHVPGAPAEWFARVTAITAAIARGELAKVVAARAHGLALAGPARPDALLAALDARHAETTRILVRPPGAGALVAATPEQLVRRAGAAVTCDALAGTTRLPPDPEAAIEAAQALRASAKDRWEHDLVVTAIRAMLVDAGATVETPAEPGVRVLRHVLHLHTPFHATLPVPRHLLELAARLHPTPAMGGTPTPTAVAWIREHEPARGWYASPVGWFDLPGNGELVVAIRSGVLVGARAHLWAGAGIVAGSDPDRELAETELKLRAMLGALGAD